MLSTFLMWTVLLMILALLIHLILLSKMLQMEPSSIVPHSALPMFVSTIVLVLVLIGFKVDQHLFVSRNDNLTNQDAWSFMIACKIAVLGMTGYWPWDILRGVDASVEAERLQAFAHDQFHVRGSRKSSEPLVKVPSNTFLHQSYGAIITTNSPALLTRHRKSV
jgi:hypothetical protein